MAAENSSSKLLELLAYDLAGLGIERRGYFETRYDLAHRLPAKISIYSSKFVIQEIVFNG